MSARLGWVDLARAVSILLVVLYHAGAGAGLALLPPEHSEAGTWWSTANRMLVPLRMPLFFLVSGLLAGGAVARPFSRVLRPRVLDQWWPYLLWTVLFALTMWPRYAPGDPVGFVREQLVAGLFAGGPYWFIAVLPLFFLLTRAGRDRPRLLLGLAAALYVLSWPLRELLLGVPGLPAPLPHGLHRVTEYALWYVAGHVLRGPILRLAGTGRALPGLAAGALFLVLIGLLYTPLFTGAAAHPVPVSRLLQAVATLSGLAAGVMLLPLLARLPAVARAGRYLGSRTLAIYLVHPLVISALVVAVPASGLGALLAGTLLADLLLVPAVAGIAVAVALAVHAAVGRWGPAWAFAAPGGPGRRPAAAIGSAHD